MPVQLGQLSPREKGQVPELPSAQYPEIGAGDEEGSGWFDLYQGLGVYNYALCLLRSGLASALHTNYETGSRLHSLPPFVPFA